MFAPIEKMPDDSRIWIYQTDRKLTSTEIEKITALAKEFVNGWTAHNQELKASFEIRHGFFLILMIDNSHALASGCSIDKSIHFIQKLEKEFNVSLLDRQIFALLEGDEVKLIRRKDFERMIEKEISPDAIVFNNLIETKKDLETKWELPIKNSWHGAINAVRN